MWRHVHSRNFAKKFLRPFFSARWLSASSSVEGTPLKSRSLIRLVGPDTRPFLQGLITNDIGDLDVDNENHKDNRASYTLFLNHQGRVLFDAIVYNVVDKHKHEDNVLVECDSAFRSKLISHLKLYRLRKKVEISAEDALSVWAVYKTDLLDKPTSSLPPDADLSNTFADPRLPSLLGWRVLVHNPIKDSIHRGPKDAFPHPQIPLREDEEGYLNLRYTLGVAEGATEIPVGNAFPFESNGDYLNGIDFHKGCYLGQELTARTHHTGVVRKRIMPFTLSGGQPDAIHGDIESLHIVNESDKTIGRVRGLKGNIGLGLFRIEEALAAQTLRLKLNDTPLKVTKPSWWSPIVA